MNQDLEQTGSAAESLARYIRQGGKDPLMVGKMAETIMYRAKLYAGEVVEEENQEAVEAHG